MLCKLVDDWLVQLGPVLPGECSQVMYNLVKLCNCALSLVGAYHTERKQGVLHNLHQWMQEEIVTKWFLYPTNVILTLAL